MVDLATYNVKMTGKVIDGYELESSIEAFAALFKISPQKANAIIGNQRVLKKNVGIQVARNYKQKLANIGLAIELVKNTPAAPAMDNAPGVANKPAAENQWPVLDLVHKEKPLTESPEITMQPLQENQPETGSQQPATGSPLQDRAETNYQEPMPLHLVVAEEKVPEPPTEHQCEEKTGTGIPGLALVPKEEELKKDDDSYVVRTSMRCPKCGLEQDRSEKCAGCGAYIHKVLQHEAASECTARPVMLEKVVQEDTGSGSGPSHIKMFIIPAVVAIFGAILWEFVALTLEYEFGFVAWIIGGAVGYSAAMSGVRRQAGGMICGVLVFLAIIGGKYMAMAAFQENISAEITDGVQNRGLELQEIYAEELYDAKQFYLTVTDEDSLRDFMVNYGYSEFDNKASVTNEEIDIFNRYQKPLLEKMAYVKPGFEEWKNEYLSSRIDDISTLDLVMQSLELIDLLFIFLGVGTAYKLGSGYKEG